MRLGYCMLHCVFANARDILHVLVAARTLLYIYNQLSACQYSLAQPQHEPRDRNTSRFWQCFAALKNAMQSVCAAINALDQSRCCVLVHITEKPAANDENG